MIRKICAMLTLISGVGVARREGLFWDADVSDGVR